MFALADVNSFYVSCEKVSGRICAANLSSFSVTTMAALLPVVLIMWNCK